MKYPKVISADVDFTLVPRHQDFSKRTIDTINTLRKNGTYFGIASGRPKNELAPLIARWDELGVGYDFLIGSNGCVLIDLIDNKEYEYYFMQPQQIKEAFEVMKPFKVNPTCAINGESWSGYYDEFVELSSQYLGVPARVCESEDYHEMWQNPVGKIMFRLNDPELMPEIEEYVSKHCPPDIVGFKTNPRAFEFTDYRANKGVALKNFCALHDIDIADSCAFGDTTNDNEMLKAAGTGVCLLNGTDDTKACADYITDLDVDHEGFADFIEKHVFIPNGIKF